MGTPPDSAAGGRAVGEGFTAAEVPYLARLSSPGHAAIIVRTNVRELRKCAVAVGCLTRVVRAAPTAKGECA